MLRPDLFAAVDYSADRLITEAHYASLIPDTAIVELRPLWTISSIPMLIRLAVSHHLLLTVRTGLSKICQVGIAEEDYVESPACAFGYITSR